MKCDVLTLRVGPGGIKQEIVNEMRIDDLRKIPTELPRKTQFLPASNK